MIEPTIIEISVDGDPIGQPRPQFDRRSGRVYTPAVHEKIGTKPNGKPLYGPDKLKPWKQRVEIACFGKVRAPIDTACHVHINAYFARPQKLLTAKSPAGAIPHAVKPDYDNVGKAITDAMEDAGVFSTDSRICGGGTFKWYVAKGSRPGARIRIEILNPDGQLPLAQEAAK